MKIGVLSFECTSCDKHNDLPLSLQELQKKIEEKNVITCQYCGAENDVPERVKQQLQEELEQPPSQT